MAKVMPDVINENSKMENAIFETIQNLEINREAIEHDIKNSNGYFSPAEVAEIEAHLRELAKVSKPYVFGDFELIKNISIEINAGKRPNRYILPPKVLECIEACKIHQKLKSDTAREHAANLITEHYSVMKHFLAEDNKFFKKNDFSDYKKREDHLDILKKQEPVKELKKTFTQICKLSKSAKVPWYCSSVTEAFKSEIQNIAALESDVVLIELAKGAQAVLKKYDRAKRDAYEMTFNDMLQRLQEALSNKNSVGDKNTAPLHDALRKKYQVALIDEFQDTDSVQYSIFNEIFAKGGLPLFYVGDPKQAIYSFRGGDIFTYAAAIDSVDDDKKYSLDKNYRSQPALIDAINTIFMDRKADDSNEQALGSSSVFGTEKITYSTKLKCKGLQTWFFDRGLKDDRPFKIWKYNKTKQSNPTSHGSSEARVIYNDVANEVARLLNSIDAGFGGADNIIKRVKPSDIAILVKRHAEAAYIYQALRRRGIPVVRQSNDNVFDSEEAMDLLYLLKAMLNPGNISAVTTALASGLMPVSDGEIATFSRDEVILCPTAESLGIKDLPDSMEKWILFFKDIKVLWQHNNFSTAFSRLARKTGINANLASLTMGERKVVNLKQLHDLIHQESTERHLGIESVVKWFSRQIESGTREKNDAFETRLESDADAVHIMTIFKSKGLEFPIVFAPTMWTNPAGKGMEVCRIYHDEIDDTGIQTIIHFDKEDDSAKEIATAEKAQEEVRSLYVALTRSSHRTYIAAGDLGAKDSAQATCLPIDLIKKWEKDSKTGIDVVDKHFNFSSPIVLDADSDAKYGELAIEDAVVDMSRGHASFSSISPHGHLPPSGETDDSKDFDANTAEPEVNSQDIDQKLNIFSFPAGAHTGTCWHNIFERIDFEDDNADIEEVVTAQLTLSRLDKGDEDTAKIKRDITLGMVRNVLQANLNVEDGSLKLANINESQKLAEMNFDFSLTKETGDGERNAIFELLSEEWKDAPDDSDEKIFLERLQNWETKIPGGFMTGSIDLLFKQNGKYYVLDWKSNCLNRTYKGFEREGLVSEMATHSYFLQYLIYTVAVHRYLGQCLGDEYDYDKDFGGALYIFLRGVDQSEYQDSQNGIFYTKPKKELIEKLAWALMGKQYDF